MVRDSISAVTETDTTMPVRTSPLGDRIDIAYHRLDPIHHDRSLASHDIAFFSKEQVNRGIHDIQSDYFLYQVLLQKQVGESDAEQDHGNRFPVIG